MAGDIQKDETSKDFTTGENLGNGNTDSTAYFAAKSATAVAGVALEKGASFFNLLRANPYLEKLSRSWRMYHGAFNDDLGFGHRVDFAGEQGELVQLPINHYRNIAQHIYVMITANRPVMEARAINTDYKSLAQTYVANDVLDYYMREKKLEDCLKYATELAIVLGAGFVKLAWNSTSGEIYDADPETGEINYEGEIEFSNHTPLDVVMDGTKESWDNDWLMVRSFQNRFNLMAKYPELANRLKGVSAKNQSAVYRLAVWSNDDTDDIPIYEFFHRKTEALPEGRYILFADPEIIMIDTKLPYRVIPVFRIAPSTILGTPYGYTPMFDIMPIQECLNSLYGTIMTNQNAFGVQNVWIPRGSDLTLSTIPGGLNIMESAQKPEAVNLTSTPKEVFDFLNMMVEAAETISGVNSVSRGNPEASLKSGTALALVQSMSLQFISGLQQSYVKLVEDVGTAVITILKDYAITPKTIALVGRNKRTELKQFTGDQVSDINRVVVDVGNPLSHTIAGRVQMAEQMLQMGVIKNPQQYFEVINTGRLDALFEGEMSELLLVKSENERLMTGELPSATVLDQHKMHIIEHKAVLADPDLRKDPMLVKNTLDHIQEHIDMLRNTDPALLQLIGEQPLPPNPAAKPIEETNAQEQKPPSEQALRGSVTPGIIAQPQGLPQPGQNIQGPGQPQGANLPNLPKVPAGLLSNPALQQSALGNVKGQ